MEVQFMKKFALSISIALALSLSSAAASAAQTFSFSYTFQDNNTYSGYFDGTIDSIDTNLVSGLSNVSLYRNNVFISPTVGLLTNTSQLSPGANVLLYDFFSFVNTTAPTASFDGTKNSFVIFAASDPSNPKYFGTVFAAGPRPSTLGGVPQSSGDFVLGVYSPSEIGSPQTDIESFEYLAPQSPRAWTLAPVPEPETYAMMLAGLGLLGFMARRKKSA
jgi:hypothetical protein